MTFAEKLRALREKIGLSEAKLAERAGVSFGAVHNYGLGIRTPTFPAVVKLAHALGVTCEAFADCEDITAATKPPVRSARSKKPAAEPATGQTASASTKGPSGQKRAPRGKKKGKAN